MVSQYLSILKKSLVNAHGPLKVRLRICLAPDTSINRFPLLLSYV